MVNDVNAWLARAEQVLSEPSYSGGVLPFSISLLSAIYGPESAQMKAHKERLAEIGEAAANAKNALNTQQGYSLGVIKNTVAEIQAGLITSLRAQVAGEVFADLVGLGEQILEDKSDSAKNVSAVLIAAAFEDLIRRMGTEMAGVIGRPKLEEVITALKNAGILKGGEVGIAISYLKFRNDSLHADWGNVDRPQIQSCIAFVQGLLQKHFS